MTHLSDLLPPPFIKGSWIDCLRSLGIAIVVFLVLLVVRWMVRSYHTRLAATERLELVEIPVEVLSRTRLVFLVALATFAGLFPLEMTERARAAFDVAFMVTLFLQAGFWCGAAVTSWTEHKENSGRVEDRVAAGSFGVIAFLLKVAIWVIISLLALDNFGVNITALVAGLGVGGIAVALALQNILGDVFASLSITFDRPFVIGDFLAVDDFLGTVAHIGIKSTRLKSLSGEQIIMANADLLKSRVRNYGRMEERRVLFTIGVARETPTDVLERIPNVLRAAVEAQKQTRFDRSHFSTHGAASLDFETVYYVLTGDYNRHMDIQQAIQLRIHRELERMRIDFAYPTQRLLLERAPSGAVHAHAPS